MAVEIKVPAMGESVAEVTLSRWLKPDGATVAVDEPVLTVETDKANADVVAPVAGILRVSMDEGLTVPVGTVVGHIEPLGVGSTAPAPTAPAPATTAAPATPTAPLAAAAANPAVTPGPSPTSPPHAVPLAMPVGTGPTPPLSPAARRVIAEQGIDPRAVVGTGRGGLVTKEDALAASAPTATTTAAPTATTTGAGAGPARPVVTAPMPSAAAGPARPVVTAPMLEVPPPGNRLPASAPSANGQRETRQRMSKLRETIAARLVASQQSTASLTTFNEADMSAVIALRERFKEPFKTKHTVGLGFMSFFVKASIAALKAFPIVNARIDGNDIVQQHFYDIGVAVSTDKGLFVPILRDADRMSFAQIEQKIVELASRAREGKITVDELRGGTFTITNGGIFGSMMSTPILNPPQSAILGMHAITKRPVVVNDQIVIRPMMYLALTYDHRLIDGREAVQFLVRIKECIESPERMLLDV
jgi:2-oxoglutarate dehydrogenase E2 component (dihydrolipoamide succinyltransferase)